MVLSLALTYPEAQKREQRNRMRTKFPAQGASSWLRSIHLCVLLFSNTIASNIPSQSKPNGRRRR